MTRRPQDAAPNPPRSLRNAVAARIAECPGLSPIDGNDIAVSAVCELVEMAHFAAENGHGRAELPRVISEATAKGPSPTRAEVRAALAKSPMKDPDLDCMDGSIDRPIVYFDADGCGPNEHVCHSGGPIGVMRDWLDRERILMGISADAATAIERMIEDLS